MSKTPGSSNDVSKRNRIITGVVLIAAGLTIFGLSQSSTTEKRSRDAQQSFPDNSTQIIALGRLKSATVQVTENSSKLALEANERLRDGKLEEAIPLFRKALNEDPRQKAVHFNLAIALARTGKKEEAKAEYTEALRIDPNYAEAHNNLGNLLMNGNNLQEAITHFQAAIQAEPENASAHNNLVTALAREGQILEAIPNFSEATRLQPDYPEAHCNLGNAYLGENRVEEALREFKAVLRNHPDFRPALKGIERAQAKQ